MAKQIGDNCIEGCFGNIVFYKLGKNYYARMKSSLDRKRVKRDPAFKKTMEYASLLGAASTLASEIYRCMVGKKKEKRMYKKLVGKVMRLLKEKKTKDEIIRCLLVQNKIVHSKKVKKKVCQQRILFANAIIQKVFSEWYVEDVLQLRAAPG